MHTLPRRFTTLLVAAFFAVSFATAHAVIDGLDDTDIPAATDKQSRTIKLLMHLIDKSHYHKRALNDEFSEKVLDTFIERLDPGRNVFLQTDIAQFKVARYQFDDFIRNGTLAPVFHIFKIMRMRMEERVEFALARLDKPFDFARDETYLFDRSDAGWASNVDALNDLWRKRIKNDILNLRLAGKDEADIRDTLQRRYTHMARRTRQFTGNDVFEIFANAYTTTIEPYTGYFSPRSRENFDIQMRLSLEGIGAILQMENEYTQVRRIIPGGPADLGRELKAEDRIIGVAQGDDKMVDIIGWRIDDVVKLIRGPKASIVRLEVLPGEDLDGQSKIIAIKRDKINLEDQAAKKRLLRVDTPQGETTIGVIDLPSFYVDFDGQRKQLPDYRSTTRDVRKLIGEFAPDKIDGLVIDLRGNGGGSLVEAISLAGLFIDQGPVVQVRDARGRVKIERDPDPTLVYDGPLAVLVDRYSASASEIFAGAVQDYRRGVIIGEPTFGKGTVQHLVDLERYARNDGNIGQLKITTAQFFRVSGDSTQYRGVVPDIAWATNTVDDDPFGERAHDNAIPWRRINATPFRRFRQPLQPAVFEQMRKLHAARVEASAEFEYAIAAEEMNAESRRKKRTSLNEAVRKKERENRDAKRLELENRMRAALGRDEVESVAALDLELEEKTKAGEADRIAQEPDVYLREGGHVLSDYLHALKSPAARGAFAENPNGQSGESSGLSNF